MNQTFKSVQCTHINVSGRIAQGEEAANLHLSMHLPARMSAGSELQMQFGAFASDSWFPALLSCTFLITGTALAFQKRQVYSLRETICFTDGRFGSFR